MSTKKSSFYGVSALMTAMAASLLLLLGLALSARAQDIVNVATTADDQNRRT